MGIDRDFVAACGNNGCRFDKGSVIIKRKISLLQHLWPQFGYQRDVIAPRQNRLTAEINRYRCSGCLLCVHVCSYDAIAYDKRDGVAEVNGRLCNGCGSAAVCPSGSCSMKGSEDRHILNQIEAFV
jgi:NAD-dependent dihydropyrimidine dehydrogenase PreA subunit